MICCGLSVTLREDEVDVRFGEPPFEVHATASSNTAESAEAEIRLVSRRVI